MEIRWKFIVELWPYMVKLGTPIAGNAEKKEKLKKVLKVILIVHKKFKIFDFLMELCYS